MRPAPPNVNARSAVVLQLPRHDLGDDRLLNLLRDLLGHGLGRDLIARHRRFGHLVLVNFFTSVGVVVCHVAVRAPQTPDEMLDGTPSRWSISIAAPPPPEAARRLKMRFAPRSATPAR